MNSPTLTIPLNQVEILDTIGSYQIWKVPKKLNNPEDNLPIKRLKPAAEKRLMKIQKEAMREYKAGKLCTFDEFISTEFPKLSK